MDQKEGEIEILGQRLNYPKTIYGVMFSLGLFFLLGFSLYTILVLAKSENLGIVTEDFIVGTYGGSSDDKIARVIQHQFWTPSERTSEFSELTDWVAKASKNANDLNIDFGAQLSKNNLVNGFRRFEVYGKGRGGQKYGMWWVVNVSPQLTSEDLAKIYQEFWGTKGSVFIETYYHNGGLK